MFSFLFGNKKIKEALKNGAAIIDVRTAQEFNRGKVPGSINIPVDRIQTSIERIKTMKKPVIICCASGSRSASAKSILQSAGIKDIYNGGSWEAVLKIVNSI